MPELPEVEVTRRSIAPALTGRRVEAVRVGKPLRWPLGCDPAALSGRLLGEPLRRGKYLWLPLGARPGQGDDDAGGLLIHLGMSGSLSFGPDDGRPGPWDHFELQTAGGVLRLRDPRRFGAVVWSPGLDQPPAAPLLAHLGPEPFDPALTPVAFHAGLKLRRRAIKNVLLSGEVIVGAGNIYACEALFRAGIDPRMRADRLSRPRAERLLVAVQTTLAQAIGLGGSTLRDFRDAHGMDGQFQAQAAVYGRAGQACPGCGQPVRRILQSQRATYFCGHCQKR